MKKIILSAALLLTVLSASADEKKYVTLAYGGIESSISLATVQRITFSETDVIVTTTEGDQKFPLAEMQKITFTVDPTAIAKLAKEADGLTLKDGNLVVSGKGVLCIYNASGALVGMAQVGGQNQTVSLQGLQTGVYIVKLGNQTIKISK